jgi:hypothetical protein
MKKLYLFLTLALISFSNVNAWDTTAAKLYPLQIGNIYVYEEQELWGQTCIPTIINGRHWIKINSDTLLSGKKYFVFSGTFGGFWWWKFQRVDSVSMNVYGYNTIDQKEYLLDSLLAQLGDTLSGHRMSIHDPNANVQNVQTGTYLGETRRLVTLQSWFSFAPGEYQLMEGVGFSYIETCKFGGARYYITGCVINGVTYGDTTLTSLTPISSSVPDKYSLNQNYPNPFNPTTNISFDIQKSSFVELKMYDISGKEIAALISETLAPGSYSHTLNVGELPSGVYFYRITAGEFVSTKKMVLLK